jgi:OOP family OmpA-OmpF porin
MKKTLLATAVAISTALPTLASAQSSTWFQENRWYGNLFGSYTITDNDRQADDGWGGGLAIGKHLNNNWAVELRGQYEKLDGDGGRPDWTNWALSLDALYFFNPLRGFRPFLLAGVGGINEDYSNNDAWSLLWNVGGGALWDFGDNWSLRTDLRYRWSDNDDKLATGKNFDDWVISIGLQYAFGPKPQPPAPRAAPLPAPAPVVAPAPAPAPKPVVAPPAPAPITRTFELSADGMFAFDRADLSPVGRSRIDNMVAAMRQAGITEVQNVRIVGHTDPLGSAEHNMRLSQQRAETVKGYLVNQGIPANVIATAGAGETQLRVTEADCRAKGLAKTRTALIECLAPNRRVEATATGLQRPK